MDFPPGGDRFTATDVSLGALVLTAYSVTPQQCSCQGSALPVLSERFDIQAKAEHALSRGEMLGMLRSLLKERFKLEIHRETKEFEAYSLVVEKGGPRLHLTDVPQANDAAPLNPYHARGLAPGGGYLVFKDETMEYFAWRLSTLVILGGRVVVDKTGLDGHYDFELKFRPEPPDAAGPAADAPSIFTALSEQLGLRLQPQKVPLDLLTVEHAERPTEN